MGRAMIKICFVCTGNTCRSVMAQALTKKFLKEQNINDVNVSSRGLFSTGQQVTETTKRALKKFGISQRNRKSVKLGKIDSKTIYVALTDAHKKMIKSDKVISFSSLVGNDVPDPYGQDDLAYEKTALIISEGVKNLIELIKKWR